MYNSAQQSCGLLCEDRKTRTTAGDVIVAGIFFFALQKIQENFATGHKTVNAKKFISAASAAK